MACFSKNIFQYTVSNWCPGVYSGGFVLQFWNRSTDLDSLSMTDDATFLKVVWPVITRLKKKRKDLLPISQKSLHLISSLFSYSSQKNKSFFHLRFSTRNLPRMTARIYWKRLSMVKCRFSSSKPLVGFEYHPSNFRKTHLSPTCETTLIMKLGKIFVVCSTHLVVVPDARGLSTVRTNSTQPH